MLIAQWQDAVTRKDMVEAYSFSDFREVSVVNFTSALILWSINLFLLESMIVRLNKML